MNKSNSAGKSTSKNETETLSRRVADELHERIDQAAERGDEFERKLHERSAQVQEKGRELKGGISRVAHDNPWALLGGSLALGILIGSLASRR
jgi:ElaB/YqjD/DUF883 family membrane-anchored ribosome-binding protein